MGGLGVGECRRRNARQPVFWSGKWFTQSAAERPWHDVHRYILGAAVIALTRGEFKWKWPNAETALLAIVGGALMGIGSRLGMGCNIGAFFATVTNGDASGWIFLLGMTLNKYLSVKVLKYWIEWRLNRSVVDF